MSRTDTATAHHTASGRLATVLAEEFTAWGVDSGGCAIVDADGIVASSGALDEVLPWASVTKVVAALAVLDVVEDGTVDLDEPAGPQGSTLRHLLCHASGLSIDEDRILAAPGTRRIYSNRGIDLAVALACERVGAPSPAALLDDRVLRPLGMTRTQITGPAAHGAIGPVRDLARLAQELVHPTVLPVTLAATPTLPDLAGVLPGYGRQTPNDWGLGVEIRGHKAPHWMPANASARTFGHFGQSGSFLWVDPTVPVAAVALTGTPFGPWAADRWGVSAVRWYEEWISMMGRES